MRNKFFCLLVFSETIPGEITTCLESFNGLLSTEIIPFTRQTEILYKKFGIKNNGCYLVRPDMYIAYRSEALNVEHLKSYLNQFLQVTQPL